mmetsp:Transcript_6164/g.23785  ORF Transcript_6164/g.23785 Transcript_6164/m.23785 type:complete len:400 (-) Transcript_6164:1721-2920(-)
MRDSKVAMRRGLEGRRARVHAGAKQARVARVRLVQGLADVGVAEAHAGQGVGANEQRVGKQAGRPRCRCRPDPRRPHGDYRVHPAHRRTRANLRQVTRPRRRRRRRRLAVGRDQMRARGRRTLKHARDVATTSRQGGEPASLGALVVHGGRSIGFHRDFADAVGRVPGGGVRHRYGRDGRERRAQGELRRPVRAHAAEGLEAEEGAGHRVRKRPRSGLVRRRFKRRFQRRFRRQRFNAVRGRAGLAPALQAPVARVRAARGRGRRGADAGGGDDGVGRGARRAARVDRRRSRGEAPGAGFGQGFVSSRAARDAAGCAEAVAGAGHRAEGARRAQSRQLRGAKAELGAPGRQPGGSGGDFVRRRGLRSRDVARDGEGISVEERKRRGAGVSVQGRGRLRR